MTLEHSGILNPETRELVLERSLAASGATLSLDQLKLIVSDGAVESADPTSQLSPKISSAPATRGYPTENATRARARVATTRSAAPVEGGRCLHLSSAAFRRPWPRNSSSRRNRRSRTTLLARSGALRAKATTSKATTTSFLQPSGTCSSSRVPDEYEVKRGKWSFKHLPVIPPRFELAPLEKSEQRLNLLLRLMKRKDVTALVNACDAGREGELIFRYIVQHARMKKPIERLWLQSMTPQSIREGFARLRADKEMLPLADAAKSRSEADWLVGHQRHARDDCVQLQGRRLLSDHRRTGADADARHPGRARGKDPSIHGARLLGSARALRRQGGRVPWPLVRPAVQEGRRCGAHRPSGSGTQSAPKRSSPPCEGKKGVATEETKPSTQLSPLLFDLTSLQREANGRFGFPARMTLSLAQALYEKHKVLTYPRTDSRALPEDYLPTVKRHHEGAGRDGRVCAAFATQILKQGWVKPNKRIFDNTKISDHFAIIPTLQTPKHLNEAEQKLYDMVVRRFLAVFYPAAEYPADDAHHARRRASLQDRGHACCRRRAGSPSTARAVGEESENLSGRSTQNEKVSDARGRARSAEPDQAAAALHGSDAALRDGRRRQARRGRRAARGDGGQRAWARRRRARPTIEGLIREEYIHREGRELRADAQGVLAALRAAHAAARGARLARAHRRMGAQAEADRGGQADAREFMEQISETRAQGGRRDQGAARSPTWSTPPCRRPARNAAAWCRRTTASSSARSATSHLWKVTSGPRVVAREVAELITKRVRRAAHGLSQPHGQALRRGHAPDRRASPEFDFGQGSGEGEEAPDFSGQEPLGACPKCGGRRVRARHGLHLREGRRRRSGAATSAPARMILQQPIEREQMKKLLATGRTDLLTGFVSKKGRRFKAFLVKHARRQDRLRIPAARAEGQARRRRRRSAAQPS